MRFSYSWLLKLLLCIFLVLSSVHLGVVADDDDDGESGSDSSPDPYLPSPSELPSAPYPAPAPGPGDNDADDMNGSPVQGVVFLTPPDVTDSPPSATFNSPEGALLMDIPARVSNWDEVTRAIPGWYGWNYPETSPCIGYQTWSGVLCRGPAVIEVNLKGLGLKGILSPDVLKIQNLETLDLSNNAFGGYLPPQWSSRTLRRLDLMNNKLTGELPAAYGSQQTFPSMARMSLDGNDLNGQLPGSEWLSNGFAPQAVITVRPGNDLLCGSVPVVDPKYYSTMPEGGQFKNIEGPSITEYDPAFTMNTSQVYLVYRNLFGMTPHTSYPESYVENPGIMNSSEIVSRAAALMEDPGKSRGGVTYPNPTNVVITNTLGTCSIPCGQTAPLPSANLLEASWEFNVTLRDLLRYNAGLKAGNADVGKGVALPCYDQGMVPPRSGSDVALGMFAGGNQRSVVGTVGAEIAGAVVRGEGLDVSNEIFFEGIMDWQWEGNGMKAVTVEPVYWFVDLGAEFTITAVTMTSGESMSNISLYVGTNTDNIFGNTLVAENLDFGPKQDIMVPIVPTRGTMVILYAAQRPKMSLANVKAWAAEANMAVGKPVLSSPDMYFKNDDNSTMSSMADARLSTCMDAASTSPGSNFYVMVDNENSIMVDAVIVALNNTRLSAGQADGEVTVFVTDNPDMLDVSNVEICGRQRIVSGSSQTAVECDMMGRYAGVIFNSVDATQICELDVFVSPDGQTTYIKVSSQDIVGIVVGSVLGGAALCGLIILAIVWRKKKRSRRIAANKEIYQDAEKGIIGMVEKGDSMTTNSIDSFSPRKFVDPFDIGSSSREHSSAHESPTKMGRTDSITNRSSELNANLSATFDTIAFSDIELVRKIGEGSYGLVWLGRYLQTSVAVKVLTHDTKRTTGWDSSQPPSDAALLALQKEASIMASLRHPNCVQYLACCLDPPALVMEYCSRRSVDKILAEAIHDDRAAKQIDWVHLLGIATDAAKGMLYLHSRSPPIIHRDLKSPNLLVDALWHVKISDFNLSRAMEQDSFSSSLQITNPRWLAPEILRGEHGGKAADVYSFGVVLWELLTWRLPWGDETNPFTIINSVINGKQLIIPDRDNLLAGNLPCYDEYVELIKKCWSLDPLERPNMDHIAHELRNMLSDLIQTKINSSSNSTTRNTSSSE